MLLIIPQRLSTCFKRAQTVLNGISRHLFSLQCFATVVGRHFASKFWNRSLTRFSRIPGKICISRGYQDLLPGFYRVFTFSSMGIQVSEGKTYQKPMRTNSEHLVNSYDILLNSSQGATGDVPTAVANEDLSDVAWNVPVIHFQLLHAFIWFRSRMSWNARYQCLYAPSGHDWKLHSTYIKPIQTYIKPIKTHIILITTHIKLIKTYIIPITTNIKPIKNLYKTNKKLI